MSTFEWTEIGKSVLPEQYREQFLAMLRGEHTDAQLDRVVRDGETPRWREPNGTMPMSPGLALQQVIAEFDIRPVTAVSYNMAWLAHDTTGKPGYFGDYSCTYTVLGVRTRRQALYFLDGGASITPVLIETYPQEAAA